MSERKTFLPFRSQENVSLPPEALSSVSYGGRKEHVNLQGIKRIIFVGSSGVGKSTLQRGVLQATRLDPELVDKISVPSRVVTRQPRQDDGEEIFYCSPEEFDKKISAGELGLYGIKKMERDREEKYGYTKSIEETLPIFFANNGVLKNPELVGPTGILDDALIISIFAPNEVRRRRVLNRSPELLEKSNELAFRFSPEEDPTMLAEKADFIIYNFGIYEQKSLSDILQLLKLILNANKAL